MKLKGTYTIQQVRNNQTVLTLEIPNTISTIFLEYLSQLFSGNETTPPKYVGFGLGSGTSDNGNSYTQLDNELLRVGIQTYSTSGSGVLTTQTVVTEAQLSVAGITEVNELAVFCVNSTDNEATVSTTVNTGTLVSRVLVGIQVQAGDEFIIKRTDTVTGG